MPDLERPSVYNNGSESDTDDSIRKIPLPSGPLPGRESSGGGENLPVITAESKTTYSSAPVLRDLVKEAAVMVPASVQRQKLSKPPTAMEDQSAKSESVGGSRQPMLEEYGESDEESPYAVTNASAYAPEEEEYMRMQGMKRKAEDEDDEEEDFEI